MRILNFGPLWIRIQIRIQGYVINFKPEENNVTGREGLCLSLESLNGEFMSSILHLLLLIYPKFNWLEQDPYSKCKSGSTKVMNTDPIWFRIRSHNPVKNTVHVEKERKRDEQGKGGKLALMPRESYVL